MIIVRAPYRVSFMGGGSDYRAWYERFGGAVLTSTIDRYCYVCLRRMPSFLGSKYRVFWSKMEMVNNVDDIEHPGVRGCLQYLRIDDGIEVNHAGDLPARSGLGSSSAFTVAMLHALHTMTGYAGISHAELANQAIEVEQEVLGETVGIQDQIECAWGGLNHIQFEKDGSYSVRPVMMSQHQVEELEAHLVLVFTNIQRYASEIAKAQVSNVDRKQRVLESLVKMVPYAVEAMKSPVDFGEMLHQTWMLKRELSDKITNQQLDSLYETARKLGAIGGKVLGAGGGGFFLFCVPPDKRRKMLDTLGLYSIPVKFEHKGSQVILE